MNQAPIPAVQPICSLKTLRAIYGVIYAEFNIAPVIIFHSVFPALFFKPLHDKEVSPSVLAEVTIITLNSQGCAEVSKFSFNYGSSFDKKVVAIERWNSIEFFHISTG